MSIYNTGTVAVTGGDATVVGTGTGWAIGLVAGGMFSCAGHAIPILSVTDDTHLELAYPWPASSASGQAYAIAAETSEAATAFAVTTKLASVLARMAASNLPPIDAGVLLTFDTGTSDANPGDGRLRASDPSIASAAYLYVSKTSRGGSDIGDQLLSLNNPTGGVKADITITDSLTEKQATAQVTGAVDGGSYVKLAISGQDGEIAFAADALISFQFARAGNVGASSPAGLINLLTNPDGRVNQRGASSGIANDVYAHDRWYVLRQSNNIDVSTVQNAENGTPNMIRLSQANASAQRMGYAQIIEGKDCKHLRGKQVTLGGRFRYSNAAAVRTAILEWTGTEDAVTSDVVNSWTNGTFTAGQFFKSANQAVAATQGQTPAAATLTDLTAMSATLGTSFNNLIVFIWTEGTAAQNSTLDFMLQLEKGGSATTREVRPIALELEMCRRFYQEVTEAIGTWASTAAALMRSFLPTPLRSTVTPALKSGSSIGVDCFGVGASTSSSFTLSHAGNSVKMDVNTLSPTRTANLPAQLNASTITLSADL